MNRPPIQIVTTPRRESCRGKAVWDGESAVLRASFEAAPSGRHEKPETLREHIDETLQIRRTPLRVVVGGVDIAYRSAWQIDSIEFRTNPSVWKKESIGDVRSQAAPSWIAFDVEPDDNGIFTLDIPTVIGWDAVANRLALRFGVGATRTWYAIADTVVAGISVDGSLAELHFSEVEVRA